MHAAPDKEVVNQALRDRYLSHNMLDLTLRVAVGWSLMAEALWWLFGLLMLFSGV